MVKKINSKINCMVRFNCCMGYHPGFSLLYFLPARQLWPPWRIWGISTVLYMMSSVPPHILPCHLSVFSNRKVMEYWDDSWWCSYYGETISLQRFYLGVGVNFIVGVDFSPVKTFVGAYILSSWDNTLEVMSRGTIPGFLCPRTTLNNNWHTYGTKNFPGDVLV